MNEAWKHYIVPAARAAESFFWRLAFFALLVCFLAAYNPLRQQQPVVVSATVEPESFFAFLRLVLLALGLHWITA